MRSTETQLEKSRSFIGFQYSDLHEVPNPQLVQKSVELPLGKSISKSHSQGSVTTNATCCTTTVNRKDGRRSLQIFSVQKDLRQPRASPFPKVEVSNWKCRGPFTYCFPNRDADADDDGDGGYGSKDQLPYMDPLSSDSPSATCASTGSGSAGGVVGVTATPYRHAGNGSNTEQQHADANLCGVGFDSRIA